MTLDDDDSNWVEALRADLPSPDQQERTRRRLLGAGLAVGSELIALGAAAEQASASAAVGAKLAALSWTAKLGLAAALTASVAALPLWLAPTANAPQRPAIPRQASARPILTQRAPNTRALPIAPPSPQTSAAAPPVMAGARVAAEPATEATTASSAPRLVVEATHGGAPLPEVQPPSPQLVERTAVAAFDLDSGSETKGENDRARIDSSLAEETRLLDRAFAELAAGNRSAAAALIAEHARRFPNGLLRLERERARDRLEQASKGQ